MAGTWFSAEGDRLVTAASDGALLAWDVTTGAPIGDRFGPSRADIAALGFAPGGERLFVARANPSRVEEWHLPTSTRVGAEIRLPGADPLDVRVTDGGARLELVDDLGVRRALDVDVAAALRGACRLANRALTEVEWRQNASGAGPLVPACPTEPSPEAEAR